MLGFAFLLPGAARIAAQDAPAKRFTLQRIVFKGTRLLTDEQLLRALDMKTGGSFTQQDLVEAANKLGSTGIFSQGSYRFSPTWAEFDLVDNPHLLPLHFENCVWMTDEQMTASLKQRLPLFSGMVSEDGTLAEEIGKQMEAVLAEKGVKAKVQYMPFVKNNAVQSMNYTVIDPPIEISAIRFVGSFPNIVTALENASKSILGKEYARTILPGAEDTTLMPILQENGYLRGSFGEPSLRLLSTAADPVAKLELTVPVSEGAQYRIASLVMKGSDPIAQESAKRLSAFKTGDVANMTSLRAELSRLGGEYLASGHMGAKVRAEPKFDETAHTVSFNIDLLPGEVYKLSKLDVQGLDNAQQTKLSPLWKLNPGDVYDPTYAPSFLKKNASKLGFLAGYSLAWTQKINDDTKTVELAVFFRRGVQTH
jgi:outer membrane protein assembly factor BamA